MPTPQVLERVVECLLSLTHPQPTVQEQAFRFMPIPINEIILTEEMNRLHRNGILCMFNICRGIMYILMQLAVRNDLLHWQASLF
jgi:hypothetical protein